MQSLISFFIILVFFGPPLLFASLTVVRLDRKLAIAAFFGYFCLYLLLGCFLRIFPSLVDPR